ncbi:helix-turn-helix transcriptional regulator [Aquibacillus koreensis]|uniref:Helix-turn-helix transcriptional regulator n=1 Tax=Aquibacillus koreensis TaxID=279446 RepID=A0A9X4AJG4_9BACI|nr:helix-turn-helix transcriptional regulator [Aquibacillus koreensis]MCT2536111.1 helix-turn-helix transcriptional regulator [Aquibacillus koreensis]MDC3422036.1 helix-turn-helix transcriptional regulator [Aquibacillus koreensis]
MFDFTNRQMKIVEIIKTHEPVTGDQIADMLGVSKATIRSDLAVLVMTGYLDAKPKVGYFLGKSLTDQDNAMDRLNDIKVKDVQGLPVVVQGTTTVNDAVVTMFLEDVGTLAVVDESGYLEGIVSRKDLLKVTLGNASASSMLISLVMTRQPNIITILEEETVVEAARKMVHYQFDSLPVVQATDDPNKKQVMGRITKTTMTKLLLEAATKS